MSIRLFITAALAVFALHAAAAVDVNTASRADLETVKGVGPGLSGKILEARKTAPFKDWNDMVERVGGIGPGNAARFSQGGMTVAGAGYETGTATSAGEAKGKPAKTASKSTDKTVDKTTAAASEKTEEKAEKKAERKAGKPPAQ